MSAVSYMQSKDVFDAKISYINNYKMPYSIILDLENKIDGPVEYDIEIIYKKENLVVASDRFICDDNCETKFDLKKIFFDDYVIFINVKYDGKYYQKKLNFELEKPKSQNEIFLSNSFFYKNTSVNIEGTIHLDYPSRLFIETYPLINDSFRIKKEINCVDVICDFSFELKSEIFFGDYQFNVYLPNDIMTTRYKIINFALDKEFEEKNTSYLISKNKTIKLNISSDVTSLFVNDVFGNKKEIFVQNNSIEMPQGYTSVISSDRSINYKIKPLINDISNMQLISIGESVDQISKKGFVSIQSSFEIQSIESSFNPIVYEDEKIYFNNKNSYIEPIDFLNNSNTQRKIIPGIYKQEKVIRFADGTENIEENYFAYGLITVNTKKPLYEQNQKVELLIVVLDKYGFLVDDAEINLIITKPDNSIMDLSTEFSDIILTNKSGVYSTSIFSDQIGEYKLDVQTELEEMVVNIETYFNVVENYDFDIIRDVPVTIDPWEGPFRNTFNIIPLTDYIGNYNFQEVFSADFEIIETDADEIKKIGDIIYLKWFNLNGVSKPYYIAQTPLVSPYLYYLGKSNIFYDDYVFYENRSWLFAIDPAAKTCGITSPCICGALCAGGGEPGDGTIDACIDRDTRYEFINDVRISSNSWDYFGVGDTVEVCFDYQCDSSGSGDRVTFAYKDENTNWVAGDIYHELRCDNNNLNTYCSDITLNNYVGMHHIRGKLIWQYSTTNDGIICGDSFSYADHDDVEIEVLDKINPLVSSWNLDNGTTIGNNLNVIRGSSIDIFANWNLPLRNSKIRHDSTGVFVIYDVDSYANNQSNYSFDTSNLVLFPSKGIVRTDLIQAWDLYFNLSGMTIGTRDFNILAKTKVIQNSLTPAVGYSGINTTMSCQIGDLNVDDLYENVVVNFYKDSILMGTNLTNSTGLAKYSFTENIIGSYNITCNISTNLSNYILESSLSSATRELIVKAVGTDIIVPIISNVSVIPAVFSTGGITTISANVTDDKTIDSVRVFVIKPNLVMVDFPMVNIGGDMYEYVFSDTTLDGNYEYYIYALDNSSNPAYSSTKNFEVTGIRTFIGIQSTQKIFKLGESLNLTDYSKTQNVGITIYSEIGDIDNILYTFDSSDDGWTHSGVNDEWERGVPSDGDLNVCDSGNCWCTDLSANYENNADTSIMSPVIDMVGRSSVVLKFWKEISMISTVSDRIYFESFDGLAWNILYQNTIGAENQEGTVMTYYPSEVEGVSNAQFRFRLLTSNSGTYEGFTFDTINLSFTPKTNWAKSWTEITSSFGVNVDKLSAIKIGFNITNYDSSGSDSSGTLSPDIELQIFDGTSYTGSYKCNLDSTKTYPYYCEFVIKNNPTYFSAWNDSTLRNIQFRAINIDGGDNITWTEVKREYITPSIIENNGIGAMTAYLLEQFKNSTGGIVSTLHFAPISINSGESKQLGDYWTYSIAGNFQIGNYTAYVALTDASGNVLQNEDDGSYINDSYDFQIQSLIINPITPVWDDILNESFTLNLTLDTSSYGSGGACWWYSTATGVNLSMTLVTPTNFIYPLTNIVDNSYDVTFFCNDTDGDIVDTGVINFNVSEVPRISYVFPTDADNSFVNRSWTLINLSINDSSFNQSWTIFDGINYTMACNFVAGINHNCFVNISSLKNGLYSYMSCANDSLNNIGCTGARIVNINKTLPKITILSPLNNSKLSIFDLVYGNISINSPSTELDVVWLEINSNGTFYNLNNYTLSNWIMNISLTTGKYSVTFYGNDTLGNIFNSDIHYFTILPDKNIRLNKKIENIGNNSYLIELNITNYGRWENYTLYDYVDNNFTYFDFSLSDDGTNFVFGQYGGNIIRWNLTVPILSSLLITYKINGTFDFYNLDNYIVSID